MDFDKSLRPESHQLGSPSHNLFEKMKESSTTAPNHGDDFLDSNRTLKAELGSPGPNTAANQKESLTAKYDGVKDHVNYDDTLRSESGQLGFQKTNQNGSPTVNNGAEDHDDFDSILREVGQLGYYQLRTVALLAIGALFMGWATTDYIFTTAKIPTRCLIPECEDPEDELQFSPPWILSALPSVGNTFESCMRFATNSSASVVAANGTCPAELFDDQTKMPCEQYVYENSNTVVYDFGLACDEWRRTLIGSMRTVGALVGQALCGLASDRWGRRTAFVVTSVNTAWLGLLRCAAATYNWFLIAHIAETVLGSGGFSCAFILMMEIIGPKYRHFGGTVIGVFISLGQASTALIAWALPQWRMLTLTLYLPQLITIAYFWILPESMRWLMSKGRNQEAVANLQDIARVNGRVLSEKSLEGLRNTAEEEKKQEKEALPQHSAEPWLVVAVWRCRPVLMRCMLLPVWWVSFTFVYSGLTINSVTITGNTYVNFIVVSLIEIPGFILAYVLMSKFGRKPVLMGGFWICAACQIAYLFIPTDVYGLMLTVYLVGKCSISLVGTTMYTYTSELFPTQCRNRLFSFCSMMGRIGAIIAPLTPAFGPRLPFILFGSLSFLAGSLALLLPETLGQRLPDTLDDTTATGRLPRPKS